MPIKNKQLSDVVEFTEEHRCVVRGGIVVSSSCYIFRGDKVNPKNFDRNAAECRAFTNELLKEVKSEPAVIDVGIMEKGWAVIETNQVWASGLYGSDLVEVLETMRASCSRYCGVGEW